MPTSSQNDIDKLPIVGIVIPCHNQANYILKALDSIVNQDYEKKVICIIDDGSTDDLEDIFKEIKPTHVNDSVLLYKYKSIPIYYFKNENPTGPSAARNKGFEILSDKCDVFSVLDADDQYLPRKLSRCVEKYMIDPGIIGIVYHDVIIHNELNNTNLYEYREPFTRQRLEQECIICNCPLISKKAIQLCGGYDVNLRTCEDWDLWLRITARFAIVHIAEPLSIYTVTGQNTSETISKEVWQRNWSIIRQRIQAQYAKH